MNHTELFKSFDKSKLPKWVKEAAKKAILDQKINCSGEKYLVSAFVWGATKDGHDVWEHLTGVMRYNRAFEEAKIPTSWKKGKPTVKKAAPKKLGFKDIKVCATIRACKNIPGIVRQKLIAEVIDVANGVYKETHPYAEIDKRHSSVDFAMLWKSMPSGHRIWDAVNDCAEDKAESWPW